MTDKDDFKVYLKLGESEPQEADQFAWNFTGPEVYHWLGSLLKTDKRVRYRVAFIEVKSDEQGG